MTDHHPDSLSPEDLDSEALDWFVRYSRAPEAAEADANFQGWLAAHPDRAAAVVRWRAAWHQLDALPTAGIALLRRQMVADKESAAQKAAQSASVGFRAWFQHWTAPTPQAALAAIVLSVMGGGGYLAWDYWQQQPVFAQQFATGRGEQVEVRLPDGSRLVLDTATQIDVMLSRQRREVRLPEGQVVFQVQGDTARPFDVLAADVRVTVVGTRFVVRHTVGQPVQVAVEEGWVRVTPASSGAQSPKAVLLTAGQQVMADGSGGLSSVAPVSAAGIAPWRDGLINFSNVPLAQVLAELERYGPTQLVVRDPDVAALRLTGTFDPRRLDNFRQSLPKVLPVRLHASGGAQSEIVAAAR